MSRNWSRDWSKMDWMTASPDPNSENPITKEELAEYIEWIKENEPDRYQSLNEAMSMILKDGVDPLSATKKAFHL